MSEYPSMTWLLVSTIVSETEKSLPHKLVADYQLKTIKY